tara:strand:- start:77624 stop:78451 length:828 start_codon:yes stop_codon:yes gene_type:complete
MLVATSSLYGQMERTRAVQDGPVEDIFLAGSIAGLSTVTALPAKNLNTMVMHNFGLVSGGIDEFFGLDGGAAVRLGIDYGITDRLDIGIGRTSLENMVDLRVKYVLLQQLRSDDIPIQIALKGGVGIATQKERRFDYSFTERLNYLASVLIARKFSDQFSLQVSPMISHQNTVVKELPNESLHNTLFGIGLAGRYKLNARNAVGFEFLPVIGPRNTNTKDHVAISYEIDTGGHVFQIFFMTGRWFTEQHLLSRTNDDFSAMDFRLGFNINRFFGL